MSKYEAAINRRAEQVIAAAMRDDIGVYRWIKALVAETVKDYRGRFLHELIQNAYDAHPLGSSDGKIAVQLREDEGDHGVLYVANGGNPLSESNFERMASLGDSDKSIGIGIGNKGVGFKSVFQICETPEVYSAEDVSTAGFSGFSFRFGRPSDLDTFLEPHDPTGEKIRRELSLSLLTVPLGEPPPTVASYRNEGFVTVLRLPLVSAKAMNEVRTRIGDLIGSTIPILLFLDRIGEMSLSASSTESPTVLTRHQHEEDGETRLVLNGNERYLRYDAEVSKEALQVALREAVDAGILDDRWLRWDASARVSVAVGDDWEVKNPAAYTYLPMGKDARSPLGGHINAPFITDFARLSLDPENPVNALLLREIARVCIRAGRELCAARRSPNAAIDMLAWEASASHLIESATEHDAAGSPLGAILTVPVLGRADWAPIATVQLWPSVDCEVITQAEVIAACGAPLIDTQTVTEGRIARIQRCLAAQTSLTPTQDTLADWSEGVALAISQRDVPFATWRAFYDDLAALFSSGEALYGRRILLTEDKILVAADDPTPIAGVPGPRSKRRRSSVFFAPRATGTEDDDAIESDVSLSPPSALAKRIVFTNRELEWYDGTQQTAGRKFLQDERLARPFRTASLLGLLGQVMLGPPSDSLKRAGLEFAFQLFAANPNRHASDLNGVGLFVPSRSGKWVRAAEAKFSSGWEVPGAEDLTMLVEAAPNGESEFARIGETLIAAPAVFTTRHTIHGQWRTFLQVIGVSTSLPLYSSTDGRRIEGQRLNAHVLAGGTAPSELPTEVREQWATGITARGNRNHPETQFTTSDSVFWFAGQGEIQTMPALQRRAFARLVLQVLPTLTAEHKNSMWSRDRPGGFPTQVETPLWAFVNNEPWVPVQEAGGGGMHFATPREVWFVGPEDHMAAAYSDLADPPIRRIAMSLDGGMGVLHSLGMLDWADDRHSARLIEHLSRVFQANEVPETVMDHFRGSLSRAWGALGDGVTIEFPEIVDGLLVDKAGRLVVVNGDGDGDGVGTLFISSTSDQSATAKLVRELGALVLLVENDQPAALQTLGDLVAHEWGGPVHLTSRWSLEVFVDNERWIASDDVPRLVESVPWLPLLFAACMRFPRASGIRVGRQLSEVIDLVGRIRFVRAEHVQVSSAEAEQSLPPRLRGVLPIPGDLPTIVAEQLSNPLTWPDLESVAQGVLELVGQERFKAEVLLAIRDLSAGSALEIEPPQASELAEILGVSESQIRDLEAAVSGALDLVIQRLRYVVPTLWGGESLVRFDQLTSKAVAEDDLLVFISNACGSESEARRILNEAMGAATPDQLRLALGISLADHNAALREHFPHIPQVDRGGQYGEEFRYRVVQRKTELIDRARRARLDRFLRGVVQEDWPSVRALDFLAPDAAWGTSLDELPVALIDIHIDEQCDVMFGAAVNAANDLPPIDDVRDLNGAKLRARIAAARPVVTVWCEQQDSARPPIWDGEDFDGEIMHLLARVGALDFLPLSDTDAAEWLGRVGSWPAQMAMSLDIAAHGLASSKLRDLVAAEVEERAQRARATRQVHYQGSAVDVDASLTELVERISQFLDTNPASLQTAYRTSSLADVSRATKASKRGGVGTASRTASPSRLSSAQTSAIGAAGELIAFRWLALRDPSGLVDAACWKSTNVRLVSEGDVGNDGLGFDFEVPRRGGSVMYEVKATSGEAGMIELGETEVRCAQAHARSDRWRLLIVEGAMSDSPRVHLLPNPFHAKSRHQFRFEGNSLRLRFLLAD